VLHCVATQFERQRTWAFTPRCAHTLWCIVVQCGAVRWSVFQCVAVCCTVGCSVLQCTVVCCSVLQRVVVCCIGVAVTACCSVLHRCCSVVMCCSVLRLRLNFKRMWVFDPFVHLYIVFQCVAVCCSVLCTVSQRAVLLCVAACCCVPWCPTVRRNMVQWCCRVVVCCAVLQCVAISVQTASHCNVSYICMSENLVRFVAACCSVLQVVAV